MLFMPSWQGSDRMITESCRTRDHISANQKPGFHGNIKGAVWRFDRSIIGSDWLYCLQYVWFRASSDNRRLKTCTCTGLTNRNDTGIIIKFKVQSYSGYPDPGYPVTLIIWATESVLYGTHIHVHVHAIEHHAHMPIVQPAHVYKWS